MSAQETPSFASSLRKLQAVQFADRLHGWAAGSAGIFATRDGGATWSRQYGSATIAAVDFVDARHGWAAAGNSLLFTTDGRSWSVRRAPCLASVHFVNARIGWGVSLHSLPALDSTAILGSLVVTHDGGRRWTSPSAPSDAQSVCFSDTHRGWLGAGGSVYRTRDGGRTWRKSGAFPYRTFESSPPSGADAVAQINVQCAGRSTVWVSVVGVGAALSHEPHAALVGGDDVPWRAVYVEPYTNVGPHALHAPDSPGSYPGTYSAISPSAAAFVEWTPPVGYGEAEFAETFDGGASLDNRGVVPDITTPTGISFSDADHGVVVGAQNTRSTEFALIEQTSDGGRTWHRRLRLS